MNPVAIEPIANPLLGFTKLFNEAHVARLFPFVVGFFFFIWVIFTAVATYHIIRYGHQSRLTVPALATHLLVSGILFAVAFASIP